MAEKKKPVVVKAEPAEVTAESGNEETEADSG